MIVALWPYDLCLKNISLSFYTAYIYTHFFIFSGDINVIKGNSCDMVVFPYVQRSYLIIIFPRQAHDVVKTPDGSTKQIDTFLVK